MLPDSCSFCQGRLVEKNIEVEVKKADGECVYLRVSPYVCDTCGEVYYTPEVSRKLDRITYSR